MGKEVQEYFDEESSEYERIRWQGNPVARYDFKVTKETLSYLLNESEFFLDIGCGSGVWLDEYSKNYTMSVGVDVSKKMLQLCKKKDLPHVSLVLADCHKLPFKECVFDTIMSSRVFIYLNLEVALSEAKRALKKGGRFILLVQIKRRSLYFKLRELLKKSVKFLESANYLTAQELIAQVSKHFHVRKIKGVIFHEHISQRALISPLVIFLLDLFYLKPLYFLERKLSSSFFKYFYASSIAVDMRKVLSD